MATKTASRKASVTRDNTNTSNLGGLAPINTPTRRFYGSQDQTEVQEPGVSNPNIYVVQPFKQHSKPKDLTYAKKNAPNPAENLLNSTIELINHFTRCYDAVKHQLQDDETNEQENPTINKTMIIGTRNHTNKKSIRHRPAKQARLRPLIVHENQVSHRDNQTLSIGDCVGISATSDTNEGDDLVQVYDEKLRLLRKLKPEFFDSEGKLRSQRINKSYLHNRSALSSYKKSSLPTPHDARSTAGSDHRTFVTEYTKNKENDDNYDDDDKCLSLVSNQQTSSINEMIKDNYILKVIDIKTTSSKQNQTQSTSEKRNHLARK